MLRRKLTKAEHDALAPALKVEYKAVGEDFELDAEGADDVGELRRAKDREAGEAARLKTENAALTTKLTDAVAKLDTITSADQRRAGDVVALENSYKAKLETQRNEYEGKLTVKDKFIQSTLVDTVATQLASELSGENAEVLIPHIKSRLSADLSGTVPLTRVLDKEGKPTANSITDLKKEFSEDKRFAPIIIASRASGSGAPGGNRNSGGNGGAGGSGQKKFQEHTAQERTDWYKRDPEGFLKASSADEAERKTALQSPARRM